MGLRPRFLLALSFNHRTHLYSTYSDYSSVCDPLTLTVFLCSAFGAESSYVFKAAALRGVNNLFSDDVL